MMHLVGSIGGLPSSTAVEMSSTIMGQGLSTGQASPLTSMSSFRIFIEHLVGNLKWFMLCPNLLLPHPYCIHHQTQSIPGIKPNPNPQNQIKIRNPIKRIGQCVVPNLLSSGSEMVKPQQVRDVIEPPQSFKRLHDRKGRGSIMQRSPRSCRCSGRRSTVVLCSLSAESRSSNEACGSIVRVDRRGTLAILLDVEGRANGSAGPCLMESFDYPL